MTRISQMKKMFLRPYDVTVERCVVAKLICEIREIRGSENAYFQFKHSKNNQTSTHD